MVEPVYSVPSTVTKSRLSPLIHLCISRVTMINPAALAMGEGKAEGVVDGCGLVAEAVSVTAGRVLVEVIKGTGTVGVWLGRTPLQLERKTESIIKIRIPLFVFIVSLSGNQREWLERINNGQLYQMGLLLVINTTTFARGRIYNNFLQSEWKITNLFSRQSRKINRLI